MAKKAPKRKRGRPPKLSNVKAHWERAWRLAKDIDPHYSMKPDEQKLLFKHALTLPKKSTIVELGVTHGKTATILAYAADQLEGTYTGVDNFKIESSQKAVVQTLKARKLKGTILAGNTDQVPWKKQISLLLIDAGHDRLNMQADCSRWIPYIAPRGLVAFHAYNPDIDQTDPHFFVRYFADHYTGRWPKVDYTPNLLIRRNPAKSKA